MGQPQTYIRGGGTNRTVPPPIQSKAKFYSSSKRLSTSRSVSENFSFKDNNIEKKVEAVEKKFEADIE